MARQAFKPAVRLMPMGEIKMYAVSDDELTRLADGSPATTYGTAATFLLSVGLSFVGSLLLGHPESGAKTSIFTIITAVTMILGVVFGSIRLRMGNPAKRIVDRIRTAPPPAGADQQKQLEPSPPEANPGGPT